MKRTHSNSRRKQSGTNFTLELRVLCFNTILVIVFTSQLFVVNGALGQSQNDSNSTVWRKIEQSDAQMQKSHIEWKLLHVSVPDPRSDVDAVAERAASQVKSQGASVEVQKSFAKVARASAQRQQSGFVFHSVLEIVRSSSVIVCDVLQSAPQVDSKQASEPSQTKARYVDYSDGTNIVLLEGLQSDPFLRGELVRRKSATLKHSVPTTSHELFLTGGSIAKVFPPSKTVVKDEGGQSLTLETVTQQQLSDEISIPIILRSTISKKTWRPLKLEMISPKEKGITVQRFEASDYQLQSDGVWFPHQVEIFQLYGKGTPISSGRVATEDDFFYKDTYTLARAEFGKQADISVLNSPIPQGSVISDNRFEPRPSVRYKSTTGVLPNDTKVLGILEQQEQQQVQDAETKRQQKSQRFALFGLPLGALIAGLGVVFWMRSRRSSKA